MLEIIALVALVLALLCLAGSSTPYAVFFMSISVACAAWRAYRAREAADRAQRELNDLRAEMQRLTTLSERAVRIAAETANQVMARTVSAPPADAVRPAAPPSTPQGKPEFVSALDVAAEVPKFVAKPEAEVKAAAPIAPKIVVPPAPVVPPPPSAPPQQVSAPPPPAPRVVEPASPAPPQRPAAPPVPSFATVGKPSKAASERMRSALNLEQVLGTNWLNKIGVIILVLGIALFGIYELGQLGPLGKVGLSLAVSLALLGGGIYLERKDRYKVLGRTGIGGGWALLFFTTYALDHVMAMRVMSSDALDSLLMLVVAGAMVAHTLRYKSQLVTGFAFLLAYSTVALSHDTVYSLAAGAILATAIVAIVLKMDWFELEVFAILSSYGNHFYWLYRLLGEHGAEGHPFPEFMVSASLLVFYWAIFRVSYVVRRVATASEENLSTVAALLNTVLLLAVMKFQSARPELAFYALLILGAMEFTIAQLSITRRRRIAFVVLTMLGTALMIAAVPFKFSGGNVSILWLAGGEVLLFAGIFSSEHLFRRLGMVTGFVVLGQVLIVEFPRMIAVRATSPELALIKQGVVLLAGAVVFYGNNALLRMRWPRMFSEYFDDLLLTATSYPGAVTLGLGCWAAFVHDSMAVAFAAAMLAVAVIAYWLKSWHVQIQFGALGVVAVARCLTYNAHWDTPHHLPWRIGSLIAIAAVFYIAARFTQHNAASDQQLIRGLTAATGTALVGLLFVSEVPAVWQPLAFALFALGLVESARLTGYLPLRWHTHVVAATAVVFAAATRVSTTPLWHSIHTGLWKLIPVVAVFYVLGLRAAKIRDSYVEWVGTAYSWAASALAVWLLYEGLNQRYVAAAWIVYACILMVVSRWRGWTSPAWQALVIGGFASVQVGVVNLLESTPGVHNTLRLSMCGIVIGGLYLLSQTLRLPDQWRKQEFEQLHSWLATGLLATLLWYELPAVSVAVAWALLGLAVYEFGSIRKLAHMRWQGYLVLLASFGRIFFANLSAGTPGDWLSTRMVTVLPIAAIYYFVFGREVESEKVRRWNISLIFAYLGTAAVMAVFYFQFANEWVVVAWAALVPVLLALALLLKQNVFAQQTVLMSLAVLVRGMLHNLFGGSYFSGSDWRGRFGVLGTAVLLLLAALPLAFEYRRRYAVDPALRGLRRAFALAIHRIEQPIFFVAIALLTTMLTLKMDHGMITLAWGVEAVVIFVSALALKERSFRLTGLILLLMCVGKIIVIDAWRLAIRDRYLTFIGLGASLILVSFLYSKYSERIRQYL